MRTTVLFAVILAALAAAVPAAAGEEAPRGTQGVFAPVAASNPNPATVTSSGPATAAEGTAGIVSNPELLTPIVSPAPVRTTAANLRTPASAPQGDQSVIPFTVPVPVPAAMAYPPQQQRYPQQYQEQLRQYQEQQLYQRQQYEEQLRLRREYEQQQEYIRQQHAALQQQLADQQQQIQQQLQQLAMQQQQISAQTDALQREALALQQQSAAVPYAPFGPYQPVRQFDPNSPVPPQPPMRLAPSARNLPPAQPQFAPPPAEQPLFSAPGTQPLPAQDFVNTLRNPSTGGEKPVLALITPAEVKQALNLGVRLVMLDVRSGLVRDVEGIIPGSVPVPYEPAATFGARVERVIPRSGAFPVVVFCSDGIWSAKATETLAQMGYSAYLMGAYRLWVS